MKADIGLYGSFAETGRGHGTDRALVAGLLGMKPDDLRIPESFSVAKEQGLSFVFHPAELREAHPNTAVLTVEGASGKKTKVQAASIGGGRIRVDQLDGVAVDFTGIFNTLIVRHMDVPGELATLTKVLSDGGINIANMSLVRDRRGGSVMTIFEIDQPVPAAELEQLKAVPQVLGVIYYEKDERQVTEEQSMEKMRAAWHAMLESAVSYQGDQRSRSGLVGGDGAQMRRYAAADTTYSGPYVQEVIATALSVGESNACMRKIVAAPTAGACGVLPAVLVPLYQMGRATEEEILQALYTASGIGAVVSFRACIAGASGGCQAEIGTASAMAAGALTSLRGGDPQQIGHAAAMALKNLMGLVCDPVAGLVEVPCVKRNVVGSVNAVSCADMALAGVGSRIPVDEVIDCMGEVGRRMPMEMRETALGGLAATPTGKAVKERMEQQD